MLVGMLSTQLCWTDLLTVAGTHICLLPMYVLESSEADALLHRRHAGLLYQLHHENTVRGAGTRTRRMVTYAGT